MTPKMRACWSGWLLMLLLSVALPSQAAVRAWLDRDHIALGETATLNIEVDGAVAQPPDYAPLLGDFRLSGHSSSRSLQLVNGRSQAKTLFAVALRPMREGVIAIPALQVDGRRTSPMTLTVAHAATTPARAGDGVFIEAEADARSPWVQQAVGYVVRLYAGVPLVSGQLDQPAPDGASLQRVGDDLRYSREIGGRQYTVIERHYLLIPERSGRLVVPAAQFSGRGVTGFFDEFLGTGDDALQASGASQVLQVRAIPDAAPQPWLPLRDLNLRWTSTPQQARAGAAVDVTVQAHADGATAAQMPELQLPPIDGAQVFADPAQVDEGNVDGRPQTTVTRHFSIVPSRGGTLQVPGPRLQWWDVETGRARTASVPALTLEVAAGGTAPVSAAPPLDRAGDDAVASRWLRIPGVQDPVRPWALATVLFALAWLLTLAWGLHRRPAGRAAAPAVADAQDHAKAVAGTARQLRKALDDGDFGEVATALCESAVPPVGDLDALVPLLADPRQRDAVAALQRARWGDGDGSQVRTELRDVFRHGIHWQGPDAPKTADVLPPLFPAGKR